jgi:putative transposase
MILMLLIASTGIPFHDRTIQVTRCDRICIGRRKINLSTVFGGQHGGIREAADSIWLVSFMEYDPGFFDEKHNTLEPVGGTRLLQKCYRCDR